MNLVMKIGFFFANNYQPSNKQKWFNNINEFFFIFELVEQD